MADAVRYVITGGCGAIGSRLVRHLLATTSAGILVLDDLSSGYEWLLPKGQDLRLEFQRWDISVSPWHLRKGDVVFHLAAHFANERSTQYPENDLLVNGLGTLHVIRAAIAAKADRVVFASAGCAAGHTDSPYQIHKTLGETYCQHYFNEIPTAYCRFHNSYGPGEVPGQWRNVIPNMIWRAMHDLPLVRYGDGTQHRDFIYVDDLVKELADTTPGLLPREIGTGVPTSINQLIQGVRDITGSKSKVIDWPRRRWDHPGRMAITDQRPRVRIVDGLQRTFVWFRENYEAIKACGPAKKMLDQEQHP